MRRFKVARGVHSIAYGPDSTTLWVGDANARVHRWDLAADSGSIAFQVTPGAHTSAVYNLAVSADGGLVAASSVNRVTLWDTRHDAEVRPFDGDEPSALGLALARSGRLLAVAGPDGATLADLAAQRSSRLGPVLGFATHVAFSPDEAGLAVASMSGPVAVFDTATLAPVATLDKRTDQALAFTPDGSRLALAVGNEVVLWDVAAGRVATKFRTGQAFVRCLAIHPSNGLVATGGDVKRVSLWGLDGAPRGQFDFGVGKAQAVAFAPDGMTAAVGGSNGHVAIWDLKDD